jgi:hypothetical protein
MFKGLAAGTVLTAALFAGAQPSFAQSLLQRMFGYGYSRTPQYQLGRPGPYSTRGDAYGDEWQEDLTTYRTLCVRLCDGFYFPMSNNVRRERLYRDNRACTQRCDGEARLFYYPTSGGSVETMVDLAGRSYSALPNAFRYRKTLAEGCTCKPAPWSVEEAARHQGYAAEAGQTVAGGDGGEADAIAGIIEVDSLDSADGGNTGARTAASDVYTGSPYGDPAYLDSPYTVVPRPQPARPGNFSRWSRTPGGPG